MNEDHRSYIRNFCSCEKKAWKKFRLVRDSNPWPLRYRYSVQAWIFFSWLVSLIDRALHRYRRSRVRIPYKPEFFSSFLLASAKIAYITAMIFLHIILHSAVHIYDFLYIHNFIIWISVSCFDGFTVWLWIEDPVVYCHPTTTPDVHLKTNTNTRKLLLR